MPLIAGFRSAAVPSPSSRPHRAPSPGPLYHRRLPVVGALLILSVGTITAISCRAGCRRFLPLSRPKYFSQSFAEGLHSSRMEATGSIVPTIAVYVTVPNKDAGKKLAESIIKEKLAACVNLVPGVQSMYWWDGKVQSDSEELLIIKTRESLLNALTDHVKSNHEYEVPEVISLPITGGNDKYLEWIKNSTREN